MKVFVVLRDSENMPLDYSLGGVYSTLDIAEEVAMKRNGDWYIEEVILDKEPVTNIERAKEYLEDFGYTIVKIEHPA